MYQVFQMRRAYSEPLEPRLTLSSSSLAVGSTLFTSVIGSSTSSLYASNLDGSSQQLLKQWSGSGGPINLFAYNGKLLFSAVSLPAFNFAGAEPWVSDGTADGTLVLGDLYEGAQGSNPGPFHLVNGHAVFTATNSDSMLQIYTTDGTQAGTHLLSPFLQNGYDYAASNVDIEASSVSWDYTNGRTGQTDRLSSDGSTNYSVLYSEAQNGVIKVDASGYDPATLTVTDPGAGFIVVNENGAALRFRTSDATAISLIGSNGDDTIVVDSSINLPVTVLGNYGNDSIALSSTGGNTLSFANYIYPVTISLSADGAAATVGNGDIKTIVGAINHVIGGDGNDTIVGTSGAETLDGGAGNDSIVGNGGGDSLIGGAGADTLVGSKTNDTIVSDADDTVIDPSQPPVVTAPQNVFLRNGVLRVYGTSAADTITLAVSGTLLTATVNGTVTIEALADVSSIVVFGGAGR